MSPTISFSYTTWTSGCGFNQSRTGTATIEDDAGNSVTHSFIISVQDTTPPTFTMPINTTVYRPSNTCNADVSIAITGTVTAIDDNCSSTPSDTYIDVYGLISCSGLPDTLYREWRVEDDCGNVNSQIQTILIPVSYTHLTLPTTSRV